jgi:Protein of unknown function (DUF2848)
VLSEIGHHPGQITLRSWVTNGGVEEEIQSGRLADLPPPSYWVEVLKERGLFAPGTIVLSGTLNMREGVNQFPDHWRAEMNDPVKTPPPASPPIRHPPKIGSQHGRRSPDGSTCKKG